MNEAEEATAMMVGGHGGYGAVARQVGRLFGGGSAVALGEDRLLARFVADRDEAAFEALVGRHGPMVLGTCRRMLADPRDVEDAFQATFLVLARRAASIRDADRLGPWLHGVARRVASRSRALAARRRAVEGPGGEDRAVVPADAFEGAELRSALDEELARLPEKYRAPLVLCYLEGLTHDEAARHLRWPVGTVRSRLAGGRDRLRSRLTRRGLSPASAALPATLPAAALSPILLTTTARLATATGTVPAHVAALAKGALIAMMTSKLKAFAAVGLMAGLAAGGVGAIAQQAGEGPAAAKVDAAPKPEAAPKEADTLADLRKQHDRLSKEIEATLHDTARVKDDFEEKLRSLQAKHDELFERRNNLRIRLMKIVRPEAESIPSDPRDALYYLNGRIKKLEDELKAAKAEPRRAAVLDLPGAGPASAALPPLPDGPAGSAGPSQVRPGVGMMGPTGGRAMSGGPGMSTMMGGPSGMSGPPTGRPKVLNLPGGSSVLVIPPENDRATLLNTETGARSTFRAAEGAELVAIYTQSMGAVGLKGPGIKRVAAFDSQAGEWYPLDLREPAEGTAYPNVGPDHAIYHVGRFLYVFSSQSKKWATLELKQGASGYPETVTLDLGQRAMRGGMANGKMIVTEGDIIHIYTATTGEWTHLDTKEKEGK